MTATPPPDFDPTLRRLISLDLAALGKSAILRFSLGVVFVAFLGLAWMLGYLVSRDGYPEYSLWVKLGAGAMIPAVLMFHNAAVRDLDVRGKIPIYAMYPPHIQMQHVLVRVGLVTVLLAVAVALAWAPFGWGWWNWILAVETVGVFLLVAWASTAMLLRVLMVGRMRAAARNTKAPPAAAVRGVFLLLALGYAATHWFLASDTPTEVLLTSVLLAGALLLLGLNGVRRTD